MGKKREVAGFKSQFYAQNGTYRDDLTTSSEKIQNCCKATSIVLSGFDFYILPLEITDGSIRGRFCSERVLTIEPSGSIVVGKDKSGIYPLTCYSWKL